jgi:ABC-type polysaccharide/polyol phosphate transport system ATPase subunit
MSTPKTSAQFAIEVRNVNKTFIIPHERYNSLKQNVLNILRPKRFSKFHALQDINFEVKPGEFFGIVGRNGSGKSTLLKILAQIYEPSTGTVDIKGRISPFIELGVGFNFELTGRENVYLNGAILGLSRKEVDVLFDDIVKFAELEEFIDQKLKNYSSGMQVRLAFSIAIRAHRGILLIDEVLAVGDAAFQKKCFQSFYDLKRKGNTIVFVTHDMSAIKRFCDRVLIIDKSKQIAITDPDEAESIYNELNAKGVKNELRETHFDKRWGSQKIAIKDVAILNHKGQKNKPLQTGEAATFVLRVDKKKMPAKTALLAGLAFFSQAGVRIAGPNSEGIHMTAKDKEISLHVEQLSLAAGEYDLTAALLDSESREEFDIRDRGFRFTVLGEDSLLGVTKFFGTWRAK